VFNRTWFKEKGQMKQRICNVATMAAMLVPLALVGCERNGTNPAASTTRRTQTERTTTTQSAPVDSTHAVNPNGRGAVNVDLDGSNRGTAPAGRTAANPGADRVDVNTAPGGGVHVDVKGQPARDLIRERREARREGNLPR
jgi:hypothetical protein